ncbi:MAG: glycosyltransferase family 2 protein [Planctomycetota bacterium]|nr:MAG: glycosyltransferase family 2 protein [Planctomycetota bacterium]
MADPSIGVIVPVYNGERYLAAAIESILGQTHLPDEVVVIDDGSTDDSAAIAESFGPPVRCLRQANAGVTAARNLGVAECRCELLAFLDADDLWHREKLAVQAARFAARAELDMSFSHIENFLSPEFAGRESEFDLWKFGQPMAGVITQTMLGRRELFERFGDFAPDMPHAGTRDWLLRVVEGGATQELLPEVLVYRRIHDTNLSTERAADSIDEYLRLVKASLDRRRAAGGTPKTLPFAMADSGSSAESNAAACDLPPSRSQRPTTV